MTTNERAGAVTMKGAPLTLLGPELNAGDAAPDFRVVDGGFNEVRLSDFKGKAILVSAVPSLDTAVCSLQTKRFNEEAAKLQGVQILTISQDLPFAQKRFCETEKIRNILVMSDHVHREFGLNYGVLIKENALLARSIFVIGKDNRLRYVEIVPELTQHPDYEAALRALREVAEK